MQEQETVRDELERTQLNTIEHNLKRLIEHRANTMDVLTLEDFSSKVLLTSSLSDAEILELSPQVLEGVIEQRTLEANYRQLLFNFEEGLTNLINSFSDLKDRLESEQERSQDLNQAANTDTDDILREYWSEFKEYCDNHGMSLVPVTWSRHTQYFGFRLSLKNVSERDIWLATWRDPKNRRIAVNLHFRQEESGAVFNVLMEDKEDIEKVFGQSLTWQREPKFSAPGPLVGVYENITPDRDDWQEQFEWMFTTLEELNRIFRPFLLGSFNRLKLRRIFQEDIV